MVAQEFIEKFREIDDRTDGFKEYSALRNFRVALQKQAVRMKYPYGTNSMDPTEEYYFSDGSSLTLGNPRQEVFRAQVTSKINGQWYWA